MPRIIRKTIIEIEDPTDEDVLNLTTAADSDEDGDDDDTEEDGETQPD